MQRKSLMFLLVVLVLGFVLAACGGSATNTPTTVPTKEATKEPTKAEATAETAQEATKVPPTAIPTDKPTDVPPTKEPTKVPPTVAPTDKPTDVPPTKEPTKVPPTVAPTDVPPTKEPTKVPPTVAPTDKPTDVPPTKEPTKVPPTAAPTNIPTDVPPTRVPPTKVAAVAGGAKIDSVCLVTDVGRVNDGTFNQFAYDGMLAAAKDLNLQNKYIETQAQTDYAANIDTCVKEGFDIIITVGFLIADATKAAAEANPSVFFIGVDQFVPDGSPKNWEGLQFREDQSGFLAGALAAQMSKSGTVAGVYGIEIPPVRKFRNGFEQGAKFINPDIKTLGVYIDSFTARDRGAAAAEQFIGDGADVIFGAGGPTGSGGIQKAAEKGVYVIGVDQDEYVTTFGNGEAPGADKIISSAVKRVDQGVILSISAIAKGDTWYGGSIRILSAENDGVGFAPAHDSDVPDAVTAKMNEIFAGLKDGSIETGVDPVTGELLNVPAMEATAEATP